ncbi:DUF4193 family protein [Mycolicibacterium llatzerense]|uniref:DUF4193 family protein n=1 Tax=Mycolicibacterium llatzerense TaxID=280871 RepID=UPI0009E22B72|nr:DUF4193 family protein [Mycolicibacterium llatzerense]
MTIDYDLDATTLRKCLVARRTKEFVCTSCLLVRDGHELAARDSERVCLDCA